DAADPTEARALREAAGAALAQIGRHDEAAVRELVTELEQNKQLSDAERRALLTEMRGLGANGKPALPLLLALLREHGDAARPAVSALVGVGEPAVPGLLDLLKTGDVEARRLALSVLLLMGPAAVAV